MQKPLNGRHCLALLKVTKTTTLLEDQHDPEINQNLLDLMSNVMDDAPEANECSPPPRK
jgi:hypothetical protein